MKGGPALSMVQYFATGRRKESVARVRLIPGKDGSLLTAGR